jgi:uncharacterized DUF497 family protein
MITVRKEIVTDKYTFQDHIRKTWRKQIIIVTYPKQFNLKKGQFNTLKLHTYIFTCSYHIHVGIISIVYSTKQEKETHEI